MKIHFCNTGEEFPYGYYLAVISALKTGNEVFLWLARHPKGKYFDAIKDQVKCYDIPWPNYPAFKDAEPFRQMAETSSVLRWGILYQNGGAICDLDVFFLQDPSLLMSSKEVTVSLRVDSIDSAPSPFSCGIVMAQQHSPIIKSIYDYAIGRVAYEPHERCDAPSWGEISVHLLSLIVKQNLDKVEMIPQGFLCPMRGGELIHDKPVPEGCFMLDLHASSHPEHWAGVTEEGIQNSDCTYAMAVKATLTEKERHPKKKAARKKAVSTPVPSTYRFHLLGLVHLPVTERYMGCAFTQKIVKLSKMLLSLGHEVILYGAEGSDAPCTEFVQTHTLKDIRDAWGEGDNRWEIGYDWQLKGFKHDFNAERTQTTLQYYLNCAAEINKRKRPDDFLLLMQGQYQRPIADNVNLYLTCEPGVGYRGSYTPFCAFESEYLMNFTYGSRNPGKSVNGNHYDRVIPNYFEPNHFPFEPNKSEPPNDYFFFMGRIIKRKGVMTAVWATEAIGAKLVLAGQTSDEIDVTKLPPHCQFAGYLEPERRAYYMSKAKGVFVPTYYLEAFGGVNVEAQLCGTPAITTNFGVFPETVVQGVTGFRCDTLNDFVIAARNVGTLDPYVIRKHAERYLMDNVRWEYQKWFDDLHQVYLSATIPGVKGWSYIGNTV